MPYAKGRSALVILPKKNWHVLKGENIERVKRDEARAAEEEKLRQDRIAIAEKEARTELLRQRARDKRDVIEAGPSRDSGPSRDVRDSGPIAFTPASSVTYLNESLPGHGTKTHVNFFKETEAEDGEQKIKNKERESDQKKDDEQWAKKVGLLVGLGQARDGPLDSQLNPWYMQSKRKAEDDDTKRSKEGESEEKKKRLMTHEERFEILKDKDDQKKKRDEKRKRQMDPMMEVEIQMSKHKKHKKEKRSYHDDDDDRGKQEKKKKKEKKKTIEELRAERLKREGKERIKTLDFLHGKPKDNKKKESEKKEKERDQDKNYYNSQFFPELARKKRE